MYDNWFNEKRELHWGTKPYGLWDMEPIPCNYNLMNETGDVIYIGETSDLFRRMKEHRNWAPKGTNVEFYNLGCASIPDREELEISKHKELDNSKLKSLGGRRTSGGKNSGSNHWSHNGWSEEQKKSLKNRPPKFGAKNGMFKTLPWNHPLTKKSQLQMKLWSRLPELYELWLSLGRPKEKTFAKLVGDGNFIKMVESFNNEDKIKWLLEEWKNATFT